jgi:hypothetical protein
MRAAELRGWAVWARRPQRSQTHLVLCLCLGELDRLLEDAVLLFKLDRLLPVVKGAGDMDVLGVVFPGGRAWSAGARSAAHSARDIPCESVFPHGGVGGGMGCEWVQSNGASLSRSQRSR